METKGGTVGVEMPVKVVPQKSSKLFRSKDVGARRHQMTTGKTFIEARVVSSVQLIDYHFPNRVATRGTALSISVALVRHAVVKSVGPDGDTAKRSSD